MKIHQEVLKAENRIRKFIRKTPIEFSPYLSKLCNCNVYLKLESEQLTGSFKIRGAFNKLLSCKNELNNGFITASTGNHGKAVAYVSKMLNIKGTVYVPTKVSQTKLEAIKIYGINIKKYDGTSGKTEIHARRVAEKQKIQFISPYNDIDIAAGQGTVGYEVWGQLQNIDAIFVCIGGGGLISGVAGYLKHKNKNLKIFGCEPRNSCAMSASIKVGNVIEVEHKPTLSDGSAGGIEPGSITFDFCKKYVDEYIQVSEKEIKNAMFFMIEKHHKIIEGAAAVPIASLIKKKNLHRNKNIVVVLSGSGVGIDVIREVV
ncbi:threonine/serine dehydratase [Nitrospinaceae bacterium]|nr:threonine/serine dehydratase [Nitrospinaceae bacterium]